MATTSTYHPPPFNKATLKTLAREDRKRRKSARLGVETRKHNKAVFVQESIKSAYQQGVDDTLQIVYEFFSNDYTAVDAIFKIKKLKERGTPCTAPTVNSK
jgi:hypothetical protein